MSAGDVAAAVESAVEYQLTDKEILVQLATLPPIEYDRRRDEVARSLRVRVSTLDAQVARLRPQGVPAAQDLAHGLCETWKLERWGEPVQTTMLLDDLAAAFRRHLVLPPHGVETLALWVAHAWTHDAVTISPLLSLTSPEKRCGKTTVLTLLRYTVPRPLPAANISPPALFRAIERWHPTLLIDEVDTFLNEREELRGVLNSAHCRATASVARVDGEERNVRLYSTWAPIVLARIGKLPDTLADRAIELRMRRKLPHESIARLRGDEDAAYLELRQRCDRWAADNIDRLKGANPILPDGLSDRAEDNWRPLVAIADLAGQRWPDMARSAALGLSGRTADEDSSKSVMLLSDLRSLFSEIGVRIPSSMIAERLGTMEERPWSECGPAGKRITPRQIARLLSRFAIMPKTIRLSATDTPKGYELDDCRDAFERYLPSAPPDRRNPCGTTASADYCSATGDLPLRIDKSRKPASDAPCGGVAAEPRGEAKWTG